MKQVLENVGDQYCEKDPESLSDETYLSVGNSLKKLNEVKDNLDETFERLSIEFKEKNTNYEPDLFDNIWENMEKKYTIESIYDTITMLFVDMNTIARNITQFADIKYEMKRFNPLTQEEKVIV